MPGWLDLAPVLAGPALGAASAWIVGRFTLRSRKVEEDTKLAAIRQDAIASTFEMVTRSRDDIAAQVDKERTRREALESRVTNLDHELVKARAEVDLLKRLRCPLVASGRCPVFGPGWGGGSGRLGGADALHMLAARDSVCNPQHGQSST